MAYRRLSCYRVRNMSAKRSCVQSLQRREPVQACVVRRAVDLVRRDGVVSVALDLLQRHVIDWRCYYLYELRLADYTDLETASIPDGYDECLVDSNEAADLAIGDRCDFRQVMPWTRRALACGAIVLCLYHGREVAHVGSAAISPEARLRVDGLPFEVRFEGGEALLGAAYTMPRFRNFGLLTGSSLRRFDHLRGKGFHTCKVAVLTGNPASNRVQLRLRARVYAIGRVHKLFGWQRWSERPPTAQELELWARG